MTIKLRRENIKGYKEMVRFGNHGLPIEEMRAISEFYPRLGFGLVLLSAPTMARVWKRNELKTDSIRNKEIVVFLFRLLQYISIVGTR